MEWIKEEKKKQGTFNTSQSILRENAVNKEKTLEDYRPGTKDKAEGNIPKQMGTVSNSYGKINIGRVDKDNAVILMAQKKSMNLHEVPTESKELAGGTARRVESRQDNLKTNENKRKDSALEYRIPVTTNSSKILTRLEEVNKNYDFNVEKNILPFINKKQDKQRLGILQRLRQENTQPQYIVQNQMDKLQNKIIRDEQQYRTFSRIVENALKSMANKENTSAENDDYLYMLFLRRLLLGKEKKQSNSRKSFKLLKKIHKKAKYKKY